MSDILDSHAQLFSFSSLKVPLLSGKIGRISCHFPIAVKVICAHFMNGNRLCWIHASALCRFRSHDTWSGFDEVWLFSCSDFLSKCAFMEELSESKLIQQAKKSCQLLWMFKKKHLWMMQSLLVFGRFLELEWISVSGIGWEFLFEGQAVYHRSNSVVRTMNSVCLVRERCSEQCLSCSLSWHHLGRGFWLGVTWMLTSGGKAKEKPIGWWHAVRFRRSVPSSDLPTYPVNP